MSLPQNMGRYLARPVDWTVEEATSGNKLLQFVCRYELLYFYDRGQWVDVQADNLSITGYHYLFKTDSSVNTATTDKLKAALGWDGRSLNGLISGDWGSQQVQLTVDREQNPTSGKWMTKVKWIDTADSDPNGPSLKKATPQVVQSLDAKYGAILRATAGAPASPSKAAPAPGNKLGPIETAKRAAWEAFKKEFDVYAARNPGTGEDRGERWKSLVAEVSNGKEQPALLEDDWKAVSAAVAKGLQPPSPISAVPQFADDDIPF